MKTPLCLTSFGFVALTLGLAVADVSHAQLGKPTYSTPAPPPEPPAVAPDAGKDKPQAKGRRSEREPDMGVSGGSICHVDPDLCPPNPGFPQRDKTRP